MKLAALLVLLPFLCGAESYPNPGGDFTSAAWTQEVRQFEPGSVITPVNGGAGTPSMSVTETLFDYSDSGKITVTPVPLNADGSFSMTLDGNERGYQWGTLDISANILAVAADVTVLPTVGSPFSFAGYEIPNPSYLGPTNADGSFNGFFGFVYDGPSSNEVSLYGGGTGVPSSTVSFTISNVLVAVMPGTLATPEPATWLLLLTGASLLASLGRAAHFTRSK